MALMHITLHLDYITWIIQMDIHQFRVLWENKLMVCYLIVSHFIGLQILVTVLNEKLWALYLLRAKISVENSYHLILPVLGFYKPYKNMQPLNLVEKSFLEPSVLPSSWSLLAKATLLCQPGLHTFSMWMILKVGHPQDYRQNFMSFQHWQNAHNFRNHT